MLIGQVVKNFTVLNLSSSHQNYSLIGETESVCLFVCSLFKLRKDTEGREEGVM